ncbi:MAG: acyl-CoA dehydrogenase family protein [Pseudomonadales bacterium]|nr:acyl-CoA dehydrogenase family protein [Pseudomonadales bacterium]
MNDPATSPVQRAQALEALIRAHAEEADGNRRLAKEVAVAFAENGLYRIGAPRAYSGEESDPMTQIETIETISRFDGSAGWNLMIGVETFGLMASSFGECEYLINDPTVVLCGSTAAVGTAEKVDGGYRVNGQWQFVSGCHNASLFCATVNLVEDGERGAERFAAIVQLPEFQIQDTWYVGGMRGSGSHDVHVKNAFVPANHLLPAIGAARSDQPLMRFPTGARLAYNKVAVSLGLARAGLDAFVELAAGKIPRFSSKSLRDRPSAHRAIAEAEVRVLASRALLMDLVAELWQQVLNEDHITTRERAIFQLACSDAVRGCVEAVDLVSDAAGTSANFQSHPLERIGRDVRVVRQHITVAGFHMEDGGRVLIGMPPEGAMLTRLS